MKSTVFPPIQPDEKALTLMYVGDGVNMTYYGKVTGTKYRVSPGIPFQAREADVPALLDQKNPSMGRVFVEVKPKKVEQPKEELPLPPEPASAAQGTDGESKKDSEAKQQSKPGDNKSQSPKEK